MQHFSFLEKNSSYALGDKAKFELLNIVPSYQSLCDRYASITKMTYHIYNDEFYTAKKYMHNKSSEI